MMAVAVAECKKQILGLISFKGQQRFLFCEEESISNEKASLILKVFLSESGRWAEL